MTNEEPIIALTLGDPAGIGPEIVARAIGELGGELPARLVAVGDRVVMERALRDVGSHVPVTVLDGFSAATGASGTVELLDIGVLQDDVPMGEVTKEAGQAAISAIEVATAAALSGEIQGVATAPINKEAIWAAGSPHLGHTEMLGELTGSTRSSTMFVVHGLRIFFTTRHMSLRDAVNSISERSVLQAITDSWDALTVLGLDEPRLAVAALNPHGGEGGTFGREELDAIIPACEAARAKGMPVIGPVPADAVFHQGLQGRYDGVLSHFHDQGHIAAKTLDFQGAITVTMGLPILRTSVDHGTAFDIAGSGKASAEGMIAATRAAVEAVPSVARMREMYS